MVPDGSWSSDTIDFITAIQTLPDRMRACVALFYGEDLSTADVAATIGCSEKTVENQLRTARSRLAALFADLDGSHTRAAR